MNECEPEDRCCAWSSCWWCPAWPSVGCAAFGSPSGEGDSRGTCRWRSPDRPRSPLASPNNRNGRRQLHFRSYQISIRPYYPMCSSTWFGRWFIWSKAEREGGRKGGRKEARERGNEGMREWGDEERRGQGFFPGILWGNWSIKFETKPLKASTLARSQSRNSFQKHNRLTNSKLKNG